MTASAAVILPVFDDEERAEVSYQGNGEEEKGRKEQKFCNHGIQFKGELDCFGEIMKESHPSQSDVDREKLEAERQKTQNEMVRPVKEQ